MVIFIDESGIHKQTGHSTTAVVYVKVNNLEKVERQISKIVKSLGIDTFHWAEHGWKVREKFFKQVINVDFTFKVAVFKNPVRYNKMLSIVFQHLVTEESIVRVFIDGKKPKWYERKLKKILRDKGVSVKKLRTVRNEASQPGIQLADALAGLVRYHIDNPQKKDAKRLFRELKKNKKLWAQFIFEAEAF